MPRSRKIRVMISSRCTDKFPDASGRALSDIRKELKQEIESIEVFGHELFEVWINEATPPQGGVWDSWDVCMEAVRNCDVFISLANGDAGWAKSDGEVGICHAELMTALSHAPGKVRLIVLEHGAHKAKGKQAARNKRFQEYIRTQNLFHGGTVQTEADLKDRVKEAIHDALISLARMGVREASKGRFHSGDALDWARLDFHSRQAEMVKTIKNMLMQRPGSKAAKDGVLSELAGQSVLFVPNAIPAALSVAAAKEMVGQPFLKDHEMAGLLKGKTGGPVHIIACYKGATETQAIRLLGFPDATVVNAPFGIFVADNIQKIQFAFIANCRDETTTRHGLQRFFEWLEQTGEDVHVTKRAMSRAKIVKAIAAEAKT